MKKSQVLAALALAMALGVAAPVASTFAATSSYDQCVEANNDVYKILNEFGKDKGMTYDNLTDLVNDTTALKEAYTPNSYQLTTILNKITDGTFTAADAPANTSALYPVYIVAQYVLNYHGQVNGHDATAADFAGKTFDQVVAYNIHFPASVVTNNPNVVTNYQTVITWGKNAINAFASQVASDLAAFGLADNLTNNQAGTVVAYVNGLNSLTKITTLYREYNKLQNGACTSTDDKIVTEATKNLKAILAAYNGTTTPDGSGDAQKPVTPSTPETGANTASEESATASVSILSGVASVVTAAGVVIRKAFRK